MFSKGRNDLRSFWMPFTNNRGFLDEPRLLSRAEGMYYYTPDGRQVMDGTAGLWCVNAGHCRPPIVEAIQRQAAVLDFAPTFQLGHPVAFEFAAKLTDLCPDGLSHAFFTNSGSEAVDTALMIALAYHRASGQRSRTRLIGRERAYHGVGFGGRSVGGIPHNRQLASALLPGVDHLPHTYDREEMAFSRGQPGWGAHLADRLESILALHGPDTVSAVIVEPVAGSTGVLIPPQGYLERLREITKRHGILLIFDEVITAFGRLGSATASEFFGVTPDILVCAKGLTNAAVPMGAVVVSNEIYSAMIENSPAGIELFHGYTYSGHPLAAAAGLATLRVYAEEQLFERAASLAEYWGETVHRLAAAPCVCDVRNIGLTAAIDLIPGETPGAQAMRAFHNCFDAGLLVRVTGDTIALSPPLIISEAQIDWLSDILLDTLIQL